VVASIGWIHAQGRTDLSLLSPTLPRISYPSFGTTQLAPLDFRRIGDSCGSYLALIDTFVDVRLDVSDRCLTSTPYNLTPEPETLYT